MRFPALACAFALFLLPATAGQDISAKSARVMPQVVVNARYVYVTAFDGPTWSNQVNTDDRQAAGDVEEALRAWGKYMIVARPQEADLIVVVQKRPSEDILAVYLGQLSPPWRGLGGSEVLLWREMQKGGLASHQLPLVSRFRNAVEAAESPQR